MFPAKLFCFVPVFVVTVTSSLYGYLPFLPSKTPTKVPPGGMTFAGVVGVVELSWSSSRPPGAEPAS